MNILLGVTGSVASSLTPKLVKALQELGEVRVVGTSNSFSFFDDIAVEKMCKVYSDSDEWLFGGDECRAEYKKGDRVLHIELRDWADVLVIAPASANTLSKMFYRLADNLLTTTFLAWRDYKPVIIAPAMNTEMWHRVAGRCNMMTRPGDGFLPFISQIGPINKVLACGEEGIGAMADIKNIVKEVKNVTTLQFPLANCNGIPVGKHLGSYDVERKNNSRHGGVDLYTKLGEPVRAMEDGYVIDIDAFTGEHCGSPWWNNTWAVYVKGRTGVICYGEIKPKEHYLYVGTKLLKGQEVGNVLQVLKDDALRPDIAGHSLSMLHLEIYKHKEGDWYQGKERLDPTPFLMTCKGDLPLLEKKVE